jgi:DNA-binding LacI/PurR family transcriptional regulator
MLIPNSEYFLEVLNGASDEADRNGYAFVLTRRGSDRRRSARSRSTARSLRTRMATRGWQLLAE